jgi:hypothetical protein
MSSGGGNLVTLLVRAFRKTHPSTADRIAYGLEGLGRRFVRPARDEADVRMRDEPPRTVQHESEAGFPTLMADTTSQISLRLTSAITVPADDRNHQVWLGPPMIAHVAKPDPGRAGANYRGIGGSVRAAVYSIEADTRDIEAFSSPMVEECETHDSRGMAKQAPQCVSPPPLVGVVSPRKLDQPAKLVCDAVDEALDPGCGGRRLNAEQLIESGMLIAIAEPGFNGTVDRKWNRRGQKKHEQVLLERPRKRCRTIMPAHLTPIPTGQATERIQVCGGSCVGLSIFPPHHPTGF